MHNTIISQFGCMANRHHRMENAIPSDFHFEDKRDGHHRAARGSGVGVVEAGHGDGGEAMTGATPAREGGGSEVNRIRGGVVRGGLVGAFLKLLAAGGAPCCDLRDDLGRTALHEAAEEGDSDAAGILLSAGASVDPRCRLKITPLMLAARGGHGDVVRLLLRAGAGGPDRQGGKKSRGMEWRSTALHHAAKSGHVGVVSTLLGAGFRREQHSEAGLTAAEVSARAGHASSPAATRRLLGGGGAGSDRGGKLLYDYVHMVVEDVDIVRGLVDAGAALSWRDQTGGETALHRAAQFQHLRLTRILLRAGADANLRNFRGGTPLHVAATTGCSRIMAALLEAGADREARLDNGRTPLHLAVLNNQPDAVLLLLRDGASTEHRDFERGQTPLSEASEYSYAPIVRLLLEAGADVESRSTAGLTALHWACRFNSPDSVAILLAAGADPEAVEKATVATAAAAAGTTSLLSSQPPSSAAKNLKKAAGVVGFGDPSRGDEDPRRPFMGELQCAAERRLDPVARSRIVRLLHDAKQDRAWRRRGWLVVLVKRRDGDARASVGGKIRNVAGDVMDNDGCCGLRYKTCIKRAVRKAGVRVSQGWKRTRVGVPRHPPRGGDGGKGALTVNGPLSSAEGARKNGFRLVDARVDVEAGGAGGHGSAKVESEEGQSRRSQLALAAGTIEALLDLATVEAGVFRNVLSYM